MQNHDNFIENKVISDDVLISYRIFGDIYLLGCVSSGVTIYKQQVRAHNLACALAERHKDNPLNHLAVVGGGIAGITFTAAFMTLSPQTKMTLLERRADLCPLQQGAETRWVHPHIYDWPRRGSRAPEAQLPLMHWSEGTAAEVADTVLSQFANFCRESTTVDINGAKTLINHSDYLGLYVNVTHLKLTPTKTTIEWVGTEGKLIDGHIVPTRTHGSNAKVDAIVVACGFGIEETQHGIPKISYWRNETYGQPILHGSRDTYIISGYGDGAIVDLCRMSIERFTHGRLLIDIWGNRLKEIEKFLEELGAPNLSGKQIKNIYENEQQFYMIIEDASIKIGNKIRKDTKMIMHIQGNSNNTSIWQALDGNSSFLNKLLLLILFQAGAFIPRFDALEDIQRDFEVPKQRVIIRHGTAAVKNVLCLFNDPDIVTSRVNAMKETNDQSARELWPLGRFRRN